MSMALLTHIRNSGRTAELLWELCEFSPLEGEAPGWFRAESGTPLEVVGRDASGGRFCLYGAGADEDRPLLYVSSEGQAGTLAGSLAEGLRMMIARPYWRDCLQFSGGGDLEQMRRAGQLLEADLRKARPDLDTLRQELYSALDQAEPPMPLEALHRAVSDGNADRIVSASDGYPCEGLFGSFVL